MDTYRCINAAQAAELIDNKNAVVVDIRDSHSFAQGHIPASFNLNNENLHDFVQNADLDTPLIVCCYHGISSQSAAVYLAGQGFDTVYSLDGGFELWHMTWPDRREAN
ncbi:MAG: thiosulfate sulfurtransferase GlpE [Marinobacterium sp.]|nr:thiosulfate sulfurtransferase GlpE [Marinobacterium sp.]